jgi:hypothetical protein
MWFAAWGFLKSPVGRYVCLGILAVGLFFAVRAHFVEHGRLQGKAEASDQFTSQREKERAEDRTRLEQQIARDNAVIDKANKRLDEATGREEMAAATIRGLVADRNKAAAAVGALQDSQLHGFNVTTLKLRPVGDNSPGYSFTEERAIAACLADNPLCRQQTAKSAEDIAALGDKFKALEDKFNALQHKYDILVPYVQTVERDYVVVYNALPRRGNPALRFFTFGRLGKPKTINAPDPDTLFKGKEGK